MMNPRASKQSLNIVDRPIPKNKLEIPTVSLSAFAYLISESIQYANKHAATGTELDERLQRVGFEVGVRILELLSYREKVVRRKTELLDMLRFIHGTAWPYLFGKVADGLEQSTQADDEYQIIDHDLLINRYISYKKDQGMNQGGAVAAGIVHGMMDAAGFPCKVYSSWGPAAGRPKPSTYVVIKLDAAVMQRQAHLDAIKRG